MEIWFYFAKLLNLRLITKYFPFLYLTIIFAKFPLPNVFLLCLVICEKKRTFAVLFEFIPYDSLCRVMGNLESSINLLIFSNTKTLKHENFSTHSRTPRGTR